MSTIISEVADSIEPLLSDVISAFISHPDELRVECARMGGLLQFNVDGNPDDLPKIVGRFNKNLAALHTLFAAMLQPVGFAVRINVANRKHERIHGANQERFMDKPDWPREQFTGLLQDVLDSLCDKPPEVTEQILAPREMRFGGKTVQRGEEQSIFHIKPSYGDMPVFTTDVETAIELIFRAIGQQQGRRITISFTNVQDSAQ
jgi:predicted RNA-binding protein YlqC (UPF0109 family)